jgi:hypothetical protein
MALKQMDPTEPKGNVARKLTTLVASVSGIVLGRNCQLPSIACKAPNQARADGRIKGYSRWIQDERIAYVRYYLAFVSQWLVHLAQNLDDRRLSGLFVDRRSGYGCHSKRLDQSYSSLRLLRLEFIPIGGGFAQPFLERAFAYSCLIHLTGASKCPVIKSRK